MKTVVVYYSRYGTTRTIAQTLAAELQAEVREIKAVRERGFLGMGLRAVCGIPMGIRPMDLDFAGVERIVLCTPIWAGKPAVPVRTFLKEAQLEGKKLAVLFTTGGGKTGRAREMIRNSLAGKRVEVTFLGEIVTRKLGEDQLRTEARELARALQGRINQD
ncbi:MAG TPA: hypothetical protein PLC08_03580 [Candidatus Bipolaricaulis sp.]|nr:hypothetical protein [Candidatus Bipolaricaulis sp.]HRS14421.1 hypothetical protein [Candidatus Bipolaricaulis sp.]HRU21239.1 hypothetical protein [Candidatus Bipolaricaulis sp.]